MYPLNERHNNLSTEEMTKLYGKPHAWSFKIGPLMVRADAFGGTHVVNYYWRGAWIFTSALRHIVINTRWHRLIVAFVHGQVRNKFYKHDTPFGGSVGRT